MLFLSTEVSECLESIGLLDNAKSQKLVRHENVTYNYITDNWEKFNDRTRTDFLGLSDKKTSAATL